MRGNRTNVNNKSNFSDNDYDYLLYYCIKITDQTQYIFIEIIFNRVIKLKIELINIIDV